MTEFEVTYTDRVHANSSIEAKEHILQAIIDNPIMFKSYSKIREIKQ